MDITKYDQKTQDMMQEVLDLLATMDPKAKNALLRFRKRAKAMEDNELLGIAYYYYAYMTYYTDPDYTKFRPYLAKAIHYLLRSDDKEQLARAYNMVAVDAHNNGNFDVAYNYYMTALQFTLSDKDSLASGLIETNIGRLYSELGDHESARRHIRKGLRLLRRQKNALRYWHNLVAIYVNDGTTSLALGDVKGAEDALQKINRAVKESEEDILADVRLPYAFLKARIAFAKKEKNAKRLIRETIDSLEVEQQIHEYVEDINGFCRALMQGGMRASVGEIIDAIGDKIMETGIIHVMRIFSEIKVEYYETAKDEKNLMKSLMEQHDLYIRQREEQKRMYRYSVDLIHLASELRDEQEKVRKENEMLQIQAQTDALTGIPNRYVMNKELEAAFERAYRRGTFLGVEILDVDYFKEYNDTYGHQAGDQCLEVIAQALTELSARPGIFCARYGGDEFVIVYEGFTDAEIKKEAKAFAQQIAAHRIKHETSETAGYVTVSQGICNDIPAFKNKPWDFLSEADAALYSIKKGRGRANKASFRLKKLPDTFR